MSVAVPVVVASPPGDMPRVLITGATGHVGYATMLACAAAGLRAGQDTWSQTSLRTRAPGPH